MRVTRPFLAAVFCLVALVGCSSNTPPTVEDAKTSTPFEETTELEPTPEPDRTSFLGSVSITENAGYSMRVDFDVDWGESTSSIINDKPGEATASLPVSSVVIVTNTTSGRTYPASGDPLDFRVELLYRAVAPNTGKPICGSGIMRF